MWEYLSRFESHVMCEWLKFGASNVVKRAGEIENDMFPSAYFSLANHAFCASTFKSWISTRLKPEICDWELNMGRVLRLWRSIRLLLSRCRCFSSLPGPWKRSGVVYRPSCVQERHCRPFMYTVSVLSKGCLMSERSIIHYPRRSASWKSIRDANSHLWLRGSLLLWRTRADPHEAHGLRWWLILFNAVSHFGSACLKSFKAENILIFPSLSLNPVKPDIWNESEKSVY